ncbi:MAG: glycosyltransferase family 2 protein [Pseudomonadota bacterium]
MDPILPVVPVQQRRRTDLSVVIPAYDEADSLEALCAEIVAALDGRCSFEIVIVDDGSSDSTPQVLIALGRRYGERLLALRHTRSGGQSRALWTGVQHARGRWIATLDGDGQNDPADLPRLLEAAAPLSQLRPLYVGGVRAVRRDRWNRRVVSWLANRLLGWALHDGATDTGCGIKLLPRELFLSLPYFDHMHRFMPALAQRAGAKLRYLPVNHRLRLHGRSRYGNLRRALASLFDLLGVRWLLHRSADIRGVETLR